MEPWWDWALIFYSLPGIDGGYVYGVWLGEDRH